MITFAKWMKENLSEYFEDIAGHGCVAGFPGLTYYTDTCELYDKHEDEIWQMLADDAEGLGHSHPLELIASFNGAENVWGDEQFKNLLVWYAAERIARGE